MYADLPTFFSNAKLETSVFSTVAGNIYIFCSVDRPVWMAEWIKTRVLGGKFDLEIENS